MESSGNSQKENLEKLFNFIKKSETTDLPAVPDFNYFQSGADWEHPAHSQSPIDLNGAVELHPNPLSLDYPKHEVSVTPLPYTHKFPYSSGHLKVSLEEAAPRIFNTVQIHFHASAEHSLQGKLYELEMHIVHSERVYGNLAVLGCIFKVGEPNEYLAQVIAEEEADLAGLVGENPDVYCYEGSLTTPPCSDGVLWFVCKQIFAASEEQIRFFSGKWAGNPDFAGGKGNNREVQSLGERALVLFK